MVDEFNILFPEFTAGDSQVSDAEWKNAITLSSCYYGGKWIEDEVNDEDCNNMIILYLLAHLITVGREVASGEPQAISSIEGGASSEGVGGSVSIGRVQLPLGVKESLHYGKFNTTSYGQVYLTLLHSVRRMGGVFV